MKCGATPIRTAGASLALAVLVVVGLRSDSCIADDNILGPFHTKIRMPILRTTARLHDSA